MQSRVAQEEVAEPVRAALPASLQAPGHILAPLRHLGSAHHVLLSLPHSCLLQSRDPERRDKARTVTTHFLDACIQLALLSRQNPSFT